MTTYVLTDMNYLLPALGGLPGAQSGLHVSGINNAGVITGSYLNSNGYNASFTFSASRTQVFAPSVGTALISTDINDLGELVGLGGGGGSGFSFGVFIGASGTDYLQAPWVAPPPNYQLVASTYLTGVNNSEQVVGYTFDGRHALEELERELPEVLVLDLMMPGFDGFQVLERLRKLPGGAAIRVLVFSAKEPMPDEADALKAAGAQVALKGAVGTREFIEQVERGGRA